MKVYKAFFEPGWRCWCNGQRSGWVRPPVIESFLFAVMYYLMPPQPRQGRPPTFAGKSPLPTGTRWTVFLCIASCHPLGWEIGVGQINHVIPNLGSSVTRKNGNILWSTNVAEARLQPVLLAAEAVAATAQSPTAASTKANFPGHQSLEAQLRE